MKRIINTYNNLSLIRKLLVMILILGIIPLGISFGFTVNEIKNASEERQIYALEQSFNQMYDTIEDKMLRAHNISTLVSVNDLVNLTFRVEDYDINLINQLSHFDKMSDYAYSMELSFEESNIVFYIDDTFPVAQNNLGRYRPLGTAEKSRWYKVLKENKGGPTWVVFDDENMQDSRKYIALTRELWSQDNYSESLGILVILMENNYIQEMLIETIENQILYLETSDGTLLASNSEREFVRLPIDQRRENDRKFRYINIGDEKYVVRSKLIEKSNVYLTSLVPLYMIDQIIDEPTKKIISIYIMVCTILLLLIKPLTRTITGRISVLCEHMEKVRTGSIHKVDLKESATDEIGELIISYNYMVGKIEELMNEQFILGQEKIGAELKALQSQINPHFLYNTLDMISWMAQKGENENIRNVIQAMSKFYRLTLSKGEDIVRISDELKMCEVYMEIQKRRFRGKLQFEIDIQEDILDYLIPKITLQPFIENAIIHGISEKEDGRGVIMLTGWEEDDWITLSITDNGKGMKEEGRESHSTGSRYGMKNIEKRLSLFYGQKIDIQVESSQGIGTCILIVLPLRKGERENND